MKTYVISPSELSYICNRCAYLGKNYNLYPHRIAAGVTQTLDGMEKDFFIGDISKGDTIKGSWNGKKMEKLSKISSRTFYFLTILQEKHQRLAIFIANFAET